MAGSAGRAKGYGCEAIGKAYAFTGEAVHSRCVDEGMSRTSHAVVSLVVAHGKENVGLFGHYESPKRVDKWSVKKVYLLNPEGFGCHCGMVLAAIQSVFLF